MLIKTSMCWGRISKNLVHRESQHEGDESNFFVSVSANPEEYRLPRQHRALGCNI